MELNESSEILISRNGERSGPFPIEEVRRRIASGELLATDLGWWSGMPEWRTLALLAEFSSDFSQTPPSSPAPLVQSASSGETRRARSAVEAIGDIELTPLRLLLTLAIVLPWLGAIIVGVVMVKPQLILTMLMIGFAIGLPVLMWHSYDCAKGAAAGNLAISVKQNQLGPGDCLEGTATLTAKRPLQGCYFELSLRYERWIEGNRIGEAGWNKTRKSSPIVFPDQSFDLLKSEARTCEFRIIVPNRRIPKKAPTRWMVEIRAGGTPGLLKSELYLPGRQS